MNRPLVLDDAAVTSARDEAWGALPLGERRAVPAWPAPVLLEATGSTNEDLAALGASAAHLSVVATLDQRAGRGRLDRQWVAPPGACLASSYLLRAPASVPVDSLGWATVLVALVAAQSVDAVAGRAAASVKWPNDLLVDGKKAAGILARLIPGEAGSGHSVVVGMGINLNQTREELPVGTATSLAMAGIEASGNAVLGTVWARLAAVIDEFFAAAGSVTTPLPALGGVSLLAAARASSATLGNEVRVHLPGGQELVGIAVDLDADGCLVVRDGSGNDHHIHAGDVVHLRRADGGYA